MSEKRKFTIFCSCMAVFVFIAILIGVFSVKKTKQQIENNQAIAKKYLTPEEKVAKEEMAKEEQNKIDTKNAVPEYERIWALKQEMLAEREAKRIQKERKREFTEQNLKDAIELEKKIRWELKIARENMYKKEQQDYEDYKKKKEDDKKIVLFTKIGLM